MIERVSRADDPRIQDYTRVGDAAWLRARGLFVAEGRLVVQRLLDTRRFAVRSVLLTPAALVPFEGQIPAEVPAFVASQEVLDSITGFKFHRGCLALAERPPERSLEVIAGERRLLALEGVGNPDNVGGLFRVAAAFGVGAVLLDPASADPFYRKAIRTSMGTVLRVPFARLERWPDPLRDLRAQGYTIIALTPRAEATAMRDIRPVEKFILVVGAEGNGLSEGALDAADVQARIPMAPEVDSLNVTVAAGIALSYLT